MKYYSYIDQLNITVEELINLSPYKLKEVITELNKQDIQHKTKVISGLEDSVSRSYHVTIEQNPWVKDLLFKKFDELKKAKVNFDIDSNIYLSGFKLYIELYLRPILPELINRLINENELKLLFNILSQSDLYSNSCKKDIVAILKSKVDYAISYLNQKPIDNLGHNIKYIKSYHFYEILNLYEPYFKDKLIRLYDNIIDIVALFDTNSNDPEFRFISQAQVAFQKSQIDDVATKLLIDDNAENAIEYAYNYSSETEIDNYKSSFQRYGLFFILGIFTIGIILFITSLFKSQDYNKEQESYKTENHNKKKRTTYDNRIRFYYSLKRMTKKVKSNEVFFNDSKITPFSNPYPKTFNQINSDTIASKHDYVQIANKTGSDLIVFKMIKGRDESIYIPEDKSIFISLSPLDSLLFYSGHKFKTSKFSHFSEKTVISDIYKVRKIGHASISTISVTSIDSLTYSKNRIIPRKNIKTTNNIELNKMSIDNLYRIYYSKYAN